MSRIRSDTDLTPGLTGTDHTEIQKSIKKKGKQLNVQGPSPLSPLKMLAY